LIQRGFVFGVLSLAAIGASAPAYANPAQVMLEGTVAAKCAYTSGDQTISLGEMADPTTGQLNAASINAKSVKLTGFCNGINSTITVAARGINNLSLPSGYVAVPGFATSVGFTSTATAGSVTSSDYSSDTIQPTAKPLGLFAGDITVTLSNATQLASGVLVAGNYEGSTTITLTPSV
jgi:hypothetical protein